MSTDVLFISVFNLGCIEIAENHLVSLVKSGITNYMAYVSDKESFEILSKKGYNVTHYDEKYGTEKYDFGTKSFNSLSYLRYKIIAELLKSGKTVWYLDVDTVVLQNLNTMIPLIANLNCDLAMQSDINMPCTGCILFFPNPKNIRTTELVYNLRGSIDNDQIMFLNLLSTHQIDSKLHLLDVNAFPNGLLYFNELHEQQFYREIQLKFRSSQTPVCFVHANWMVGIDTKIKAFKSKGLWYL